MYNEKKHKLYRIRNQSHMPRVGIPVQNTERSGSCCGGGSFFLCACQNSSPHWGTVKQMGSRFILLVVFSTTLLQFLPILGEEGMLGPGWQYLGSDSSLQADVLELLPVGVSADHIYWDKVGGEHWSACLARTFLASTICCLDPFRLFWRLVENEDIWWLVSWIKGNSIPDLRSSCPRWEWTIS